MKIDDIILLGAGASMSEGAPSQANLFKEFFIRYHKNAYTQYTDSYEGEGSEDRLIKMYRLLSKFFKEFFNIDTNNFDYLSKYEFPTFEEVLGILELSINRQENFRDFSLNSDDQGIQRVRESLIFLIALIIDETLRKGHVNHKILINRLVQENKLLKTSFISLNYDILIDNALVDIYPEYHLDYGTNFINYSQKDNWRRPIPSKSVKLFKLHGSLNWLYCPTCVSLKLTPKEKKVATLVFRRQKCEVCKCEMIPIIIPPSFFKVMSNYHLQQIWHESEIPLKDAKRIFFCGYSFPDADIHIKYLLKRAEIFKGNIPEIYVINNFKKKKDDQKKIEESRYKRFFKYGKNVNYTKLSFEEFCRKGIN